MKSILKLLLMSGIGAGILSQSFASSGEKMFIVNKGKPVATIIIADNPAKVGRYLRDTVKFGAKLLQKYIEQSTGAKLPIKKESDNISGNVILVGRTKLGEKLNIPGKKLPPEGYLIKRFPNGVAIVGNIAANGEDKGTMYGVYKFLEDNVGVRWYFPSKMGTVVPKKQSIAIAAAYQASGHPFFEYRIGGISHWRKNIAQDWHPVLRFGSSAGLGSNHSMENWHALYGKSHPEYFGLRKDGTRAITAERVSSGQNKSYNCFSEPGVLKQHLDNVDDYYKTGNKSTWSCKPKGNLIPFSPTDTRQYCLCSKCKSKLTLGGARWRHGETSDIVFEFVKKYGESLKKKHPEAVICAMAYDHYQLPPLNIKKLPDNVAITLCLIPTVVQMNHPGVRKNVRKEISDWSKLVNNRRDRLIIWDYFCYPNYFFLAPTEIPHVLKEHINFIKDKALGIFNNGFNPATYKNPRLYLTYRITWLMHKLLWNPDLDLDKAKHDWCYDLFGTAGGEMEKFYTLLEDRWEKVAWKSQPRAGYVGEYSIYFETYPPKVLNQLENIYNAAITATKPGSIYRERLEWFKQKAYGPFFAKAREYHLSTGAVPQYKAKKITAPLFSNKKINQEKWRTFPVMSTVGRVFGKSIPEENKIKVAYDDNNLYIYANFEISDKSIVSKGYNKGNKKKTDEQAEFQFGAGKSLKPNVAKLIYAKATGRENSKVTADDMFIIDIRVGDKGYTELAINPNGSFSSKSNIMKERGFFPSHDMINWNTADVKVKTECFDRNWLTLVTIPWQSIPGVKQIPPRELKMEFLRWNVKDKHHYSCWSPPLSSWDFPLSRFGRVKFNTPKGKLIDKIVIPQSKQLGYISAIGLKKKGQPTKVSAIKHAKALVVGQRNLGKSWLELRGVLTFDLPANITPAQLSQATLSIMIVNVVGSEPFDGVNIQHIISQESSKLTTGDFGSKGTFVGPLFQPGYKRGKKAPRKILSIDVTSSVKNDLAQNRKSSSFRLQIPKGCNASDKKVHFIIFNGKTDSSNAPKLKLELLGK
jgi:Domain of unknown function (DUF4838)